MDKKRVLIVDDSAAVARQLGNILESAGAFEIVGHASNGIEGLKLYTELRPDIVCMDIVMPQMDGLQAIRTLMSLDRDAKVVVISSAAGVGDKTAEALRFGAKSVLSKPFDSAKVVETLSGL
ncbi:MAG: response regulator [Nitrospirota bacterium]|jgi:two-component system chemotaxis response regulator CheY